MVITVEHIIPALGALFIWWFGTGAIFYIDGLPKRTHRWSLSLSSVAAMVAMIGIAHSAHLETVWGAYLGFACAIVLWGWQELSFLLGFVTGPRRTPCPPGAGAWDRFWYATQTLLYHELAIVMTGAILAVVTWDAPNAVGWWAFLLLWAMRLSTKLNIFLGVSNIAHDFLPPQMAHLKSYFGTKKVNFLFPISVSLATAAVVFFAERALAVNADALTTTGFSLLTALAFLGLLEHWMMILPLKESALWTWLIRHPSGAGTPSQGQEPSDISSGPIADGIGHTPQTIDGKAGAYATAAANLRSGTS